MDDKLILLRVLERPDVLPAANDFDAERALEANLRAEIPHLLYDFKMPKSLRWERGQPCFRNPELVAIAHEDDAVTRILWLLDELKEAPEKALSAPGLERLLRKELGDLAARVLDSLSLGHVLRDVAKRFPLRVQAEGERHGRLTKWRVRKI